MYKKKTVIASALVLSFWLSLIFAVPARAQQGNRLVFWATANGTYELVWGAAGIGPEVICGEPEYRLFPEEGVLNLDGTSLVSSGTFMDIDGYVLEEGTAHAAGNLILKWTHDESQHELNLVLMSTEETSGIYVPYFEPGDNPYGLYSFFLIGVDLDRGVPDMFDPQYATLTCQGWYKVDGAKERIDGKAWLAVGFHTIPRIWEVVVLGLRIGGTYVGVGFSELTTWRGGEETGEWIPAARVVEAGIKIV